MARLHPDLVIGLVFIDAADSGAAERFAPSLRGLETATWLSKTAGRLGLVRLLDPLKLRQRPHEAAARAAAVTYRQESLAALSDLLNGIPRSVQELRAAPPLRSDVPLIVLTHDKPTGFLPPGWDSSVAAYDPEWRQLQQRLSRRSTRGIWRTVPGSDHLIAGSQPHAVAEAILEMLADVRHRGLVP